MSIKLNKKAFGKLLKMAIKDNSIRKIAKELNLGHTVIWRALNAEEVSLFNFIIILEYIQRKLLWSYDMIFSQLYEKGEN